MQLDNNSTQIGAKSAPLYELAQLTAYYKEAPEALRSFAWALLQLAPSPENRPALVSLMLTLDLLEREQCAAFHQEKGDGEELPTREGVIAGFWSGKLGVVEDSSLVEETPESERGAITSAARVLFALPQLASVTMSPELEADVLIWEQNEGYGNCLSECESDLLAWLRNKEVHPVPTYSEADFILDSLDPKNGGSTLEKVNHRNRVWWHCMKRLQVRLLEFAALEIPEPREFTEADVEAMRRELAWEEFAPTPEEALALVRPEALSRFLAIREASQGREWTGEEFAEMYLCLTSEGKQKIREALTGRTEESELEEADTEQHLTRV